MIDGLTVYDSIVVRSLWLLGPPLIVATGFLVVTSRFGAVERRVLTTSAVVLIAMFCVAAVGSFLLFGGTRVGDVTVANDTAQEVAAAAPPRESKRVAPGERAMLSRVGCVDRVVLTTAAPSVEVDLRVDESCSLNGRVIAITRLDGEDE